MILLLKTLGLCSKSFQSLFVYPNQWAWLSHPHSPSNRIVCYRVASVQDIVLAYRAGAHDAALSYDAARAGKNKVLALQLHNKALFYVSSMPTLNQNYNLVLKSLRNRPTKK